MEAKKEQLEELEKNEREARRLEEALSQGSRSVIRTSPAEEEGGDKHHANTVDENEARRQTESQSVYLPPHPGPSPVKRRAPGMGLLSALSYTLHGMMDVDPETARRNSITKTRETISQVRNCVICQNHHVLTEGCARRQLEDALHLSAQDLKYSSSTIQADLDRFQWQKVADLRAMAISMARSHRDWCQKVRDGGCGRNDC